jgi:hypothetical protein
MLVMPSEMRRPEAINIETFVASLEVRLRDEVPRIKRWVIPERLRHPIRTLRTITRPMLQGGAMVLTALSIIIAVGVAPATVVQGHTEEALEAPTVPEEIYAGHTDFAVRTPNEDLLAVEEADNQDASRLNME